MEDEELLDILQNLTELESEQNSAVLVELLQNEFREVPLLHKTIVSSLSRDDKQRIVRSLIEAGANCDQRDEESLLTPCEFTLQRLSDRELALEMIRTEVKNLPETRVFYVLIRRGSLEVFKLLLEAKQFSEEEIFHYVANAMIELNVKRVQIDEKLEVFLQFLLAKYAHQNLCGDVKTDKDANEWYLHFQVIETNWKALKREYSDHNFSNVDNMFVYRIQTIHNHLFFVKNKRFLRHLPMMETTFCLAIFVSIFKWSSEYEIYRMLINKINIMQFLDVICRQLVRVRLEADRFAHQLKKMLNAVSNKSIPSQELLMNSWKNFGPSEKLTENILTRLVSGLRKRHDLQDIVDKVISNESLNLSIKINYRDRSTLKKLKRSYLRIRHLYSVSKCLLHIRAISSNEPASTSDLIVIPAVKRLVQIIGEAIKTTKNSPNMPKKVESMLKQMLLPLFPDYSRHFRELFSHKYSLAKRLLLGTEVDSSFDAIVSRFSYIEMGFSFAMIQSVSEAGRTLLGFMRGCRGVDQLITLFQYVPQLRTVGEEQLQQFGNIEEMFRKLNESLAKVEVRNEMELSNLNYLKMVIQNQIMIVERLKPCLINRWEHGFETIKTACYGKTPLHTIYRMIEYYLTIKYHKDVYDDVKNHWLWSHDSISVLVSTNKDLVNYHPSLIVGRLEKLKRDLGFIESEEYLNNTKKVLEELGLFNTSQEIIQLLHSQLMKYYENVFCLDNKYKAIKLVFKSQKMQVDEKRFQQLRMNDVQESQSFFNSQVNNIRTILDYHRISSVEDLAANFHHIPTTAIMALEHCQLELCETLITVGHYGDNFHLLKHRIPLINGRNYRNYLAHDQLSYNVLTDSSRLKIVINAMCMVNCQVNLYGKKLADSALKYGFPTANDTLEWKTRQNSLVQSIQEMNHDNIQSNVEKGADLHGRFYQTIAPFRAIYFSSHCLGYIDPIASEDALSRVLKIFRAEFPQECLQLLSPSYRWKYAALLENYEKSFEILAGNQPIKNSTLPENLFYWQHLIRHLQDHSVDWDETDSFGKSFLHKLVLSGNYLGVEELLTLNPDANVNAEDVTGRSPLEYAINYGRLDLAELILPKAPNFSIENQQCAVRNHLNELIPHLFSDVNRDLLVNEAYILNAVRANNLIALEFIIKHLYIGEFAHLKEKHLSSCISSAAYLKHPHVIQYLLRIPNVDFFSDERLLDGNLAFQHAIRTRHWTIAEALLQSGASPHWIHPDRFALMRTAFQLAVEANSRKMVRLMGNVAPKLYRELHHPLAIAIENNSLRMVECLQRIGLSLLDSNRVLRSAIQYDRKEFVKWVFRALDEFIEEWKSEDGTFGSMVGNLVSRWKVIAYLEEMEPDSQTVLMEAIFAQNWNLIEILLDKCKNLRKVSEMYLEGIQVYCKEQLIYSNEQRVNPQYIELCEDLLNRLKLYTTSGCSQFKIQSTIFSDSKEWSIDAVLYNDSTSVTESIFNVACTKNLQHYFGILQNVLQGTKGLICGVIYAYSSPPSYVAVSSKFTYLLSLSQTEHKYPLKKFVNTAVNSGESPLHQLARHKDPLAPLDLLLSNGANPLAMNTAGQPPLHHALTSFDCSKAMVLLKAMDDVSALELPNGEGCRPIHLASMSGKLQAVQFLIDRRVDLRARDNLGRNATMYAVMYNYRRILKMLLDCDPQLVNLRDNEGKTPAHYSIQCQDPDTIRLILNYDFDRIKQDNKYPTAFEEAVFKGKSTWLKTFLEYARANKVSNWTQRSPFLHSVCSNKRDVMQIILEYDVGNELTTDLPRGSALKLRELLLSKTPVKGCTALHIAVHHNHEESLKFILHCQVLVNRHGDQKLDLARQTVDLQGQTPLQCALAAGKLLLVDLLSNS